MDYSAEVLIALLHELEALPSRPAVKARLEMLRSMPGKGTNLFPHAFVSIAVLPYVNGDKELPDAAIFEPYLTRFKRHWDRLGESSSP